MRKAWIWGGFVVLLPLAVGTALYPEWRLRQELDGAAAEGLALDRLRYRPVPEGQDLAPAYAQVARQHPNAVRTLLMSPNRPTPEFRAFVARMAKTARARPEDRCSAQGYAADIVASSARVIARTATSEADLRPAALIARSLRRDDDANASQMWAKAAEGTLDAMDRLRLDPAARSRTLDALGPPVDAHEIVRHWMAQTLANARPYGWPKPSWFDSLALVRRRKHLRYVQAWRRFWRSAPKDDAGFAVAYGRVETDIRAMEEDLGQYTGIAMTFGTVRLEDWIGRMDAIRRRMAP